MKQIVISNSAYEKLRAFFPWVYQDDILRYPGKVSAGEIVQVLSPAGAFVGIGYVNPESTIAARIFSFRDEPIDRKFFLNRICQADRRRSAIRQVTNAYRIIHAEADGIPGLIVDSYDRRLVVQINTAGIEARREDVIDCLKEALDPLAIYEKSDGRSREKEGLRTEDGTILGEVPESLQISENGVLFKIQLKESQKTGFYLDQRRNRLIVSGYVEKGFSVLDVFCNTGGFGIYAGRKGAGSVRMIDASSAALKAAEENARLNGLDRAEFIQADAFDYLTEAAGQDTRYDLIILDPPSFAKTKQARRGAIRGFKHLVSSGLNLLRAGGYLSVFSCSHHVSLTDLKELALDVAINNGVTLRVMEHLFQDGDHPYLLNIPQSLYLKGLLLKRD